MLQGGEGGRTIVETEKLKQFVLQLSTIQAKLASLNQERRVNAQREKSLEVKTLGP